MNPIYKNNKFSLSILWLILAAISLMLSTGRFSIGIFSWAAVFFALTFTRTEKTIRGYVLISVVSFAALSIAWYGLQPLPLPVLLGTMLVSSLIGNLPFLVDRLLFNHRPVFINTLIYPLLGTAWEFFSMTGSPLGSFGATAYSQVNHLVIMQSASLAGLWGIAFIINWTGSVLSWAWLQGFSVKKLRPALSVFILLGLMFGYGILRLNAAQPETSPQIRIAALIPQEIRPQIANLMGLSQENRAAFEEETRTLNSVNFSAAEKAAAENVDLIVFQEGAFFTTREGETQLIQQAAEFSKTYQVYLVLPMFSLPENTQEKAVNQVVITTPQGEVGYQHIKFGGNQIEGTQAGDGILQTLDTPFGTISSVICWDMDFPATILQAGRNGTQILFSPASEWDEINPLHAQMAKTRGIENGVFNVHVAEGGLSMVSDPYGRILDQWEDENMHLIEMPVYNIPTLYAQMGDVLPLGCLLFFIIILVINLVLNVRQKKNTSRTA